MGGDDVSSEEGARPTLDALDRTQVALTKLAEEHDKGTRI